MKKAFCKKTMITVVAGTTITALLPLGVSAEWKYNLDGTWNYADGNELVKGWKNISQTWYYFNLNGKMETGWIYDTGIWYYLDNSGAMQIGWIKDSGKWYYTDSTGAMKTGEINLGEKTYYLDESGALQQSVTNSNEATINNGQVDVSGLPKLPQYYSVSVQDSAESKILELMNEKRVEAGLSPLTLDSTLLKIARYRSNDMIQNNYFDHTTPQGEKWTNFLETINYQYTTTGENIAYNNYDPVELFNQWWNSPGHKANMMNSSYTKVGIGVLNGNSKYMGTQIFSN